MTHTKEIINPEELLQGSYCFLGRDEHSRQICNILPIIAKNDASVLIEGESGTGKELISQAIHMLSKRSKAPFITVNCAAIPETLLEAELFGFEKGAFTGAFSTKKGYFELAHKGTLFLDEIGDLSMHSQAKILRALQEHEIQRIGSEKKLKVDVRIISATNKDLVRKIVEGNFREDLYFRLNIIPIKIPSLRERNKDIPKLTHFILKKLCEKSKVNILKITDKAIKKLMAHTWPGNIRELQNVLERALIFSNGKHIISEKEIILTDYCERIKELGKISDDDLNLKENEKRLIEKALSTFSDKKIASKELGIPLRTLYSKIKAYDLA